VVFFDQPFLGNLPRIPRTRIKIFVWVDSLTKPPFGVTKPAVNGRYYLTSHLKKKLVLSIYGSSTRGFLGKDFFQKSLNLHHRVLDTVETETGICLE